MATKLNDDGVTFADGTVLDASTTAGATSLKVDGVTKATIGATGVIETLAGIKFPATQVASADANTLDDYEEGTWTPVLVSGAGTITSQTCTGTYVKIGNCVTCTLEALIVSGTNSSMGLVTGLPFSISGQAIVSLREEGTTGNLWYGFRSSGAALTLRRYDNSAISAAGYHWVGAFSYITA